jgi:DUF2950 family protein
VITIPSLDAFVARRAIAARVIAAGLACATLLPAACSKPPAYRTFATPEDAVRALTTAVKAGKLDEVIAIFGPEGQALVDTSDPATARRNREVFSAAVAEKWRLEEHGANGRVLVVGNEDWPFPVPLVSDGKAWHFDTEAGQEEVLARRIGRNELAAIRICRGYLTAQRLYAAEGHDGAPAGLFAAVLRSDPGRQNGLYWPATRTGTLSPVGYLVAVAAQEASRPVPDGSRAAQGTEPSPFQGYFFRILTRQGPDAPGGARDYRVNGQMSGGFALIAWPAHYDASGIMTFVVNQDGIVYEKDLGASTDAAVRDMASYNPDSSWTAVASGG